MKWRFFSKNIISRVCRSQIAKFWRRGVGFIYFLLFVVSFSWIVLYTPSVFSQYSLQEIRGVWITNNDSDVFSDHQQLQEAVDELAALNFNTLYPVVWNSGYVLYPSPTARSMGIQPFVYTGLQGQDVLADLIDNAHNRGMLVIPWFEFGFMIPLSSELAMKQPWWLTQKRDGSQTSLSAAGKVAWLNPFHPQVQKFITDLVLEIVTQYDVDGIQFDDHTCLPVEFGYDSYTINLYKQETGNNPPSNAQDPQWMRWRADKITGFMNSLHQAVKAVKPKAIFSLAPNPYPTAYNRFLQDWLNWLRMGILDELIVQIYRDEIPSFVEQINRPEIQEAKQLIPTAAGILTGLRNRPVSMDLIWSKVRASQNRGLGVTFFFYESLWESATEPITQRKSRFYDLFYVPAPRISRQIPPQFPSQQEFSF